ncbi:MAG TPA: MBL fold metallo-hydrolase [Solirubrobacteraceae bacterium]|jgi:competence protein ComEC|nr:MBL fold metallo-hydrolase [Solirubrobacteraceae bacterium]
MAEFEVIFVDVGQGDCTLVGLPDGEYMLVDVYRCPDHGIDVFKLLDDVLPDNGDGRKRLKYLVITHAHDDHITGIGDLYDRYAVEWLWVPQYEDRKQVAKNFGEYQRVLDEHPEEKIKQPEGSRTPLGEKDADLDLGEEITLRCFSPPGYIEIEKTLSAEDAKQLVHENCLVLKLAFEGTSVILTGDANLACWERILDYYEGRAEEQTGVEVLKADILHASHHGSRTFFKDGDENSEASLEPLETIAPDAVVISVGEDNRHGHPHADMLSAYVDQVTSEHVLQTKDDGTLVLRVTGKGSFALAADGRYAEIYGWEEDDDTEDKHGGSPPPPPPRPRPKPNPDQGRTYG